MCDVLRLLALALYGPLWPGAPPAEPAEWLAFLPSVATALSPIAHRPPLALERPASLARPLFADVLGAHAALPELEAWRRTFATHSDALARLVASLSGARDLAGDTVRARIESRWGLPERDLHGDVFAPWTNAWTGTWSDGSPQFHVWDRARGQQGQWVQLVAQSETALPSADRLGALVERDRVDLALNVVSERVGVTGWVSKRQHGRVEIPCLGYLLEPALLLWLCHVSDAGAPRFTGGTWMAYLEGVDAGASPPVYHIQGQPFEVGSTVTWDATERVHHHGRYIAQARLTSALPFESLSLP